MREQRRRVALDRSQRRAQLVRDRTQQLGLHSIQFFERGYLAGFVEQVQVIDGQRGVVGQRHEQSFLGWRPGVRQAALQVDHADNAAFEHHRHGQL